MKIPKTIHLYNRSKYTLVRPERKAKIQNSVDYWHSRSSTWHGAAACGVHVDEENEWIVSEPDQFDSLIKYPVNCTKCLEIYNAYMAATAPSSVQTLMWNLEEAILALLFHHGPKTMNQILAYPSVLEALSVVRPNLHERVLNKALKHLKAIKMIDAKSGNYDMCYKHNMTDDQKWRIQAGYVTSDEIKFEEMMRYWERQK